MGSAFHVGPHEVEVETTHWTGHEVYRVDGEEAHTHHTLGWHSRQELQVGHRQVVIDSRWYPLLPVRVSVDDRPHLGDLFPQLLAFRVLAISVIVLASGASLSILASWTLEGLGLM